PCSNWPAFSKNEIRTWGTPNDRTPGYRRLVGAGRGGSGGLAGRPWLRGPRGAGTRRYGRRLQGATGEPAATGRAQADPRRRAGRPARAGRLPERGGGGGEGGAREGRRDLRYRRDPGSAVFRHGARRRGQLG